MRWTVKNRALYKDKIPVATFSTNEIAEEVMTVMNFNELYKQKPEPKYYGESIEEVRKRLNQDKREAVMTVVLETAGDGEVDASRMLDLVGITREAILSRMSLEIDVVRVSVGLGVWMDRGKQ